MDFFKNFNSLMSSFIKETTEEIDKMKADLKLNSTFEDFKKSSEKIFQQLKEEIKNTKTSFIVEVPFNKENEKLTFLVDGNVINITVQSKNEFVNSISTTTATIPEEFNSNNLIQKYDEKNKKMKFIFVKDFFMKKKKEKNNENLSEKEPEKQNNNDEHDSSCVAIDRSQILDTILDLYSKGWSYRSIAKQVGISDKTVKKWIKSALKDD